MITLSSTCSLALQTCMRLLFLFLFFSYFYISYIYIHILFIFCNIFYTLIVSTEQFSAELARSPPTSFVLLFAPLSSYVTLPSWAMTNKKIKVKICKIKMRQNKKRY